MVRILETAVRYATGENGCRPMEWAAGGSREMSIEGCAKHCDVRGTSTVLELAQERGGLTSMA